MSDINMFDELNAHYVAPEMLRSFIAAADTQSFTKAAQLVNKTQSAVSMQIKRIEADLNCSLFERLPRGVQLTHEGETLYRFAFQILQLYDKASASLTSSELTGSIRIGTPEDYASLHLPAILQRFAEVFPLVRVDVYCDTSSKLLEMIDTGKLDMCLCTSAKGLAGGQTIGKMPLCWVGPRYAEFPKDEPLPLAVFHEGCTYRRWALEALDNAGIVYRIAYASPGVAGVLAAVRAGLAVAPLARSVDAPGCRRLGKADAMPSLRAVSISLHLSAGSHSSIVEQFAKHVTRAMHDTGTLIE